jgi:uncharacterized protein
MTSRYLQTVFTPAVKAVQTTLGSRTPYARHDDVPTAPDRLSEQERDFIAARDSFYLATTSETGWPYIQHRGGAPGFVKTLDDRTLGFADYRGNRQYVSIGNLSADNRAALFFMDYPNRARLKLLGRIRLLNIGEEPSVEAQLRDPSYKANVERFMLIEVEAFDWNCSQHITPRFTLDDVTDAVEPLRLRIAELEAQLALREQSPPSE